MDIGIKTFVAVSKWSVFVLSLVFTVGHVVEYFFFLNPSFMVYYSYFTELSTTVRDLEAIFDYIVCASCLVANLIEFICFSVIIREFYQLHKSRSHLLNRSNSHVSTHTKKNVITATGHFFSWLTELVLFGVGQSVLMAHKNLLGFYHWIFFMLLPSINYAVFPVVQGPNSIENIYLA